MANSIFVPKRRVAAGGHDPLSITQSDSNVSTGSTNTKSCSIGTAPTGGNKRIVAVSVAAGGGSTRSFTSITCGGVAMTEAHNDIGTNNCGTGLFYLEVNTGTTATITLTLSGTKPTLMVVWHFETDGGAITAEVTNSSITTATTKPIGCDLSSTTAGSVCIATCVWGYVASSTITWESPVTAAVSSYAPSYAEYLHSAHYDNSGGGSVNIGANISGTVYGVGSAISAASFWYS